MTMGILHEKLKGKKGKTSNDIDLFARIKEIKKRAKSEWLVNLGKNGFEHSERLEGYLDKLTETALKKGSLSQGEIFVLLCAVYLHDIGYLKDGNTVSEGHQLRSKEYILRGWENYGFYGFAEQGKNPPRRGERVDGEMSRNIFRKCETAGEMESLFSLANPVTFNG